MSRLVLVPLDGSEFSESVLLTAIGIAQRWGARLEVVTVHEAAPALDHDLWNTTSREWAEAYIEEVASRISEDAGFSVSGTILNGSPAEAIQHHMVARGVDLLIMATHGRGPMSRFWLGSTADGLVRRGTVPILLLRPDEETPGQAADFKTKRVLVPLDGSLESEIILSHAIEVAGDEGTKFDLLRVFLCPSNLASSYLPHTVQLNANVFEEGRKVVQEYVTGEAERLVERGLCAEGHVVTEVDPASAILRFAEHSGADLIAMSTHARGGVSRLVLGSVTDKVVRGARIPTLVYHPDGV